MKRGALLLPALIRRRNEHSHSQTQEPQFSGAQVIELFNLIIITIHKERDTSNDTQLCLSLDIFSGCSISAGLETFT